MIGMRRDKLRIWGVEMWRKIRDLCSKKVIIGSITIMGTCVAIVSFVLSEKRRPDEMRREEARVECITTAITEMIEVTRESNSNENARIRALEKTTTVLRSKPSSPPMWNATVLVSGGGKHYKVCDVIWHSGSSAKDWRDKE